jgi:hypothetical protein
MKVLVVSSPSDLDKVEMARAEGHRIFYTSAFANYAPNPFYVIHGDKELGEKLLLLRKDPLVEYCV